MDEARLRAASLAISLVLHAVLALVVARRAAVPLALERELIPVDLVEAARRTAGPGLPSDRLRVGASPPAAEETAAPAAAPPPSPARQAAPASAKDAPPPGRPPVVQPQPPRQASSRPGAEAVPAKDAARQTATDTAKAGATPAAPAKAEAVDPAAGTAGAQAGQSGQAGRDAVATAPAWAPTARVRYEQLLYAWIEKHKEYPLLARRRGLEGTGSVRVRIDRDGRVVENVIVRSTGDATLDRAALDMVRRANPFPRVPDEYEGEGFEFTAPVEYRLR